MSSQNERRKYARHSITFPIRVTAEKSDPQTREEYLNNISDGGISFSTNDAERYQIDETLIISIASGQNSMPILLSGNATIIWVERDPFSLDKAIVGVRFGEIIESEKYIP